MSFVETSTCTKPDEILDEPDEVFSLLKEWGLQVLHDLFKEHEIDISTLKYLSDSEIKELIPKIGHRSLFCVRLEQWRRSQNQPMRLETRTKTASKRLHSNDSISSEVDGPPPSSIVKIEETEFMESSFCDNVPNIKCNESHVLDNNLTFANINEFSVFEWLSHDADGQCILDSYNVLNCLSNEQRKNVLKTIARWMVDQKLPKTVAVFEQIRVQLLELFPTEHFTSNDLLRWFTLIENGNDPDSSIEIIDAKCKQFIKTQNLINSDEESELNLPPCRSSPQHTENSNSSTDIQIKQLLEDWNMSHLVDFFQSQAINVEVLKVMKRHHISIIFKDLQIGDMILFEHKLEKWRNSLSSKDSSLLLFKSSTTSSVSSTPNRVSSSPDHVENIANVSLTDILQNNVKAELIAKYYNYNKKLLSEHRLLLINIICSYFEDNSLHMTLKQSYKIEEEITKYFPTEKIEFYRTGKRGKLYTKFTNAKNRFSGILKKKQTFDDCNSSDMLGNNELSNFDPETNAPMIVRRLRFDHLSIDEFDSCWQACSQYRLNEISKHCATIQEVFSKWPEYKRCNGYRLIDMDFNKVFSSSLNIFEKWREYGSKIRHYLLHEEAIKDLNTKRSISNLDYVDVSNDIYIATVLLAVHAFLVPTQRVVTKDVNGKNTVTKFTIKASQDAFLFIANNYQEVIEHLNFLKKKQEKIQPFVVAVRSIDGETFEQFYVYCDDVKFSFDNLLRAVDICFKCFQLFNLEYPVECSQVWSFVDEVFYKIGKDRKNKTSKMYAMSEALKYIE